MKRLSFGKLLIGANLGLVVAAVACVAAAAVSQMRRFADQQAIHRAGLAGSSAMQVILRTGNGLQTAARLLAEDSPTLARLLHERDAVALEEFLERFRSTGRIPACAVVLGEDRFASAGRAMPWTDIRRERRRRNETFLIRGPADGGSLILGASWSIPSEPGAEVLLAHPLDREFARTVGAEIGLEVSILDRAGALRGDDPRALLRGRVIDAEAPAAERLDDPGVYVAVQPLKGSPGDVIGVVEVELPATGITASLHSLVRSLVWLSLVVGGLAALLSVLLGRRLVRPLEALSQASVRIGRGDLATPIPRVPGAEVGALADTMEEMRGRLRHLLAELRHRQGEAEGILAGIAEGVFAVDRERRIRYVNPQAAALLGLEASEAIGRFCGDVLRPQEPGGVRPCEDRCPIVHARFRGSARATEHLPRGGGLRTVVITSAAPAAAQTGDGPGAGGSSEGDRQFQVMRDETEVEATRRLRDTVLANITHEFRTPLTAQLASIELLRERLPHLETAEARDLVSSLERGALRLTQLIDNLLESVRIDAGETSIRRHPVALDEVVEEAVELTSPLIALRNQTLAVDLPYPLPALQGDAPRLVQVLVNLLANANKFAPAGSTIRIGGEPGKDRITIWVEDEGPGVPPDAGPLLFERFRRAPGEEPEESGMGLGLFIVRSIVERHGGRVEARRARSSSPVGPAPDRGARTSGGTRMCVILPVAESA
jgi:signal transduction histidine kinase